jgi:transaldolase
VSFQLNPKKADDADAMIADAEEIFAELRSRFEDGEPNIVFKVPGTYAGIPVAEALTGQGIGINVTVNYTVPQQVAFGAAIEKGNAKHSYLTNMDGRLDDPVAEELGEGKADQADKASTWAGIAVAKKAHKILHTMLGYKRSILLDASGRGPWHITRSLPGPEDHPIHKTVFPDKQVEFDSEEVAIEPTLSDEVPKAMLDKLYGSKLFRQAYEVNGLDPLEFDAFPPAVDTLTSFSEQYDEFVEWCAG